MMEENIENPNNNLSAIKELMVGIAALNPILAPLIRVADTMSLNYELDRIHAELFRIKSEMDRRATYPIGNHIVTSNFDFFSGNIVFRRAKETLLLAQYISNNSMDGIAGEPEVEYETMKEIFLANKIEDPEKAWRLAAHELDQHDLIYNELDRISPNDTFFFKTDALFQNWDPKKDAKQAIGIALEKDDRAIILSEVMEKFGWNKRRMNSVLKLMEFSDLIHPLANNAPDGLLDYYFRLKTEAENYFEL